MSPTSIHCILSHIPSFGGAWGGTPFGLGEAPSLLPFPLEWQSNSKVEGLRITEPSDVIEATFAR